MELRYNKSSGLSDLKSLLVLQKVHVTGEWLKCVATIFFKNAINSCIALWKFRKSVGHKTVYAK
jgi:hypothetical protein